jgi:hypothetical protein
MARTLDDFPTLDSQFAWDEWLDGQVWELHAGEDFEAAMPATFRKTAKRQARARGGNVRTRLLEREGREVIVLQFVPGSARQPPTELRRLEAEDPPTTAAA